MAVISLFWDTNMAAVTSCENTLYFLNRILATSDFTLCAVSVLTSRAISVDRLLALSYWDVYLCNFLEPSLQPAFLLYFL